MNGWLSNQAQALRLVLGRFRNNIFSTLLIAFAIGISMALPVILYLVVHSLDNLAGNLKQESSISVFIALDRSDAALEDIRTSLENNTNVKSFRFISKEEALDTLKTSKNATLINSLDKNPLPDAFFIEPIMLDAKAIHRLKNQIGSLAGVAKVHNDDAWLARLNYILTLGEKAVLLLIALLGLVLFAVVGNTIRMQILTQQEEIEVSQLIGATRSFVRRPFLYAGALYGLFGGLFTLLIAVIVIKIFNQSLLALSAAYQANFSLNFPSLSISLITCMTLMAISFISAYIVVSKSLSK